MKTIHDIANFLLSQPNQELQNQGGSASKNETRFGNNKAIVTASGDRLWIKFHEAQKQTQVDQQSK